MKLTNKQREEVEYLSTWLKNTPTDDEILEYIDITVNGKNASKTGKMSDNPLVQAQQRLNITLSMWKNDIVNGIVSIEELLEEANSEYEKRLIIALHKSITPKYRKENMTISTVLSFTNFPEIIKWINNNKFINKIYESNNSRYRRHNLP